jgi:hypothetical protein
MKTFTKASLQSELRSIAERGWIPSHRTTVSTRNDGAVGNLLENLLGIEENNLPLPNANEWELKVQRASTSSLVTLKHIEPSPRSCRIVPQILLPFFGWKHQQAGLKYPDNERTFRGTMSAKEFTSRGFRIDVTNEQLQLAFDPARVDDKLSDWREEVLKNDGPNKLMPRPYWGLSDLEREIGSKLNNTFYVIAETRVVDDHEYFRYSKCMMLSGVSLSGFIECLQQGVAYVDFDARTGHNHGTKFRIRQNHLPRLYSDVNVIFDLTDASTM